MTSVNRGLHANRLRLALVRFAFLGEFFAILVRSLSVRRLYKKRRKMSIKLSGKYKLSVVMRTWSYVHKRSRNWFIYIIIDCKYMYYISQETNGRRFIWANVMLQLYFILKRLTSDYINIVISVYITIAYIYKGNFKLKWLSIVWFKPFLVLSWESWGFVKYIGRTYWIRKSSE